tara:strand:- start:158 stop:451 length:294 start_codon:yes stop_codon:yes gene_type:complete
MNEKDKHTGGPWTWDGHKFKMRGEAKRLVLIGSPLSGVGEQADANAALIAAAPCLLAALEALTPRAGAFLDISASHEGLENCKLISDAWKAIERARQ